MADSSDRLVELQDRLREAHLIIESALDLVSTLMEPLAQEDPAQAVANGLDGTVQQVKKERLSWYPDREAIAAVKDRYQGVITDDYLHDVTSRFIRWHENGGQTLPYAGATNRWKNWVADDMRKASKDAIRDRMKAERSRPDGYTTADAERLANEVGSEAERRYREQAPEQ